MPFQTALFVFSPAVAKAEIITGRCHVSVPLPHFNGIEVWVAEDHWDFSLFFLIAFLVLRGP